MSALEQFNRMDLLAAADMLSKSNLVPKAYRGKPADVVVARLWGEEAGIGMFAALQYLDVIDGNPTVNADGCNALIRRAGHSLWFEMGADKCVAHGKRADTGDEMTVTWTMDMAAKAGLAGKQVWKQYGADMLKSRATTQIARALFADVLMGVKYSPEEAASFAAPDMLDAQPAELAAHTVGRELAPPVPINVETGEIIAPADVYDVNDEPAPTRTRRTFAAPGGRSQSAENTERIMAEFTEADRTMATRPDVADLKKRIAALDGFAKDSLSDQWKAAGLPSVAAANAKLTKDQLVEAAALVDAVEKAVADEAAAS